MIKNFNNLSVSKNSTIETVLRKINDNGKNGVFVVGKNKKIIGVITDSDIRKSILEGKFNKKSI